MKRLAIFEYDEQLMHSGDSDTEAREWFETVVLPAEHVVLDGSNEIADEIGTMRVLDDQATRDLDRLTNMVLNPEAYAMADPEKTREAAARLRAWAGLDGSE